MVACMCQFFVDTLTPNEQRKVAPQMTSWDSLGMHMPACTCARSTYSSQPLRCHRHLRIPISVACARAAVWRQWAVGDVIQMLNAYKAPESVNPPDPPELAW